MCAYVYGGDCVQHLSCIQVRTRCTPFLHATLKTCVGLGVTLCALRSPGTKALNAQSVQSYQLHPVVNLTPSQARQIVVAAPGILAEKVVELERKWEWLHDVLGASHADVLRSPRVLAVSLMQVLGPRHGFLQKHNKLELVQHADAGGSFGGCCCCCEQIVLLPRRMACRRFCAFLPHHSILQQHTPWHPKLLSHHDCHVMVPAQEAKHQRQAQQCAQICASWQSLLMMWSGASAWGCLCWISDTFVRTGGRSTHRCAHNSKCTCCQL